MHAVHIRRRSSQVGDDAAPLGKRLQLLDLAQDGRFGARDDLLALVRGDGAERATSEAATVHTDRETNHLVGGNTLVFIFGVRQVLERQRVDGILVLLRDRKVRRINHYLLFPDGFDEAACLYFVALRFDMSEVLRMLAFILACSFMGMEEDIVFCDLDICGKVGSLWNIGQRTAGSDMLRYLHDGLLTHTIYEQIGFGIHQDRGFEGI